MSRKIVCFGEVLWDVFPTYKKIGGAPLNVALRLQSLDNDVAMISRIGEDEYGKRLLDFISDQNVNTEHIQTDSIYKTGEVKVILDETGSATYDIMFPRAWDKIEANTQIKDLVKSSDAFVYGSLAAKDEVSKSSLYELLQHATFKIFDVNLRKPHYTKEVLTHLMNAADFIKFNDEELLEISSFMGSKYNSLEENIQYISEKTSTNSICVTKGKNGAMLFHNNKMYYNAGYPIKVADTVGAGDSFLATVISEILHENNPQNALNLACATGALVASKDGACPEISRQEVLDFIDRIAT